MLTWSVIIGTSSSKLSDKDLKDGDVLSLSFAENFSLVTLNDTTKLLVLLDSNKAKDNVQIEQKSTNKQNKTKQKKKKCHLYGFLQISYTAHAQVPTKSMS